MRRLTPTDVAWITLWIYVALCDLLLPEKLTTAMHRYRTTRYRWAIEVWLAVFYLHLTRRIPPRIDPLAYVGHIRTPHA